MADLRQHDQHRCHGNRAADARGDLRKGHELHAIGGGQDGDIARAALPAVAGGHDRRAPRPDSTLGKRVPRKWY